MKPKLVKVVWSNNVENIDSLSVTPVVRRIADPFLLSILRQPKCDELFQNYSLRRVLNTASGCHWPSVLLMWSYSYNWYHAMYARYRSVRSYWPSCDSHMTLLGSTLRINNFKRMTSHCRAGALFHENSASFWELDLLFRAAAGIRQREYEFRSRCRGIQERIQNRNYL